MIILSAISLFIFILKTSSILWILISIEMLSISILFLILKTSGPMFLMSVFILAIGSIILLILSVSFIRGWGMDKSLF